MKCHRKVKSFITGFINYLISPNYNLLNRECFSHNKGGSRSTAQQHGEEQTLLQKEAMYLLYTPSVILPYF